MANKLLIILALATIGSIAAFLVVNSQSDSIFLSDINHDQVKEAFEAWKVKFNKQYGGAEDKIRQHIFATNFKKVKEHNSKGHSFKLGLNQFADLTTEEFASIYLGYRGEKENNAPASDESKPVKILEKGQGVDWRNKNAVNTVKNQGQCGSCWAFSTVGAVEGLYAIKNSKLESFSEQQLVDCAGSFGNEGCNGGLMDNAFKYVETSPLETESKYPYKAVDGKCRYDKNSGIGHVRGFEDVPPSDPNALRDAVLQQPVSIAIEADTQVFQLYAGGVFNSKECGTQLDHGVLIVGVETDSATNQDYWIVRNSWGSSWGEGGYIKIAVEDGPGICGINLSASYPTL